MIYCYFKIIFIISCYDNELLNFHIKHEIKFMRQLNTIIKIKFMARERRE